MPTANRSRWMRDYMKEYRQGKLRGGRVEGHPQADISTKLEKLRKTQRLQSFKWRITRLLSSQYEILMYIQYKPLFGSFKTDRDTVPTISHSDNIKVNLDNYPILKDFKTEFGGGGRDIFKVFILEKYGKEFDRDTEWIVGVLDKSALFTHLQKLPNNGGKRWEAVLNKVKHEEIRHWHALHFSRDSGQWLNDRMLCHLLKWTARDCPRWNSSKLHDQLSRWATGIRRIGPWFEHEAVGSVDSAWRGMISPIWSDYFA